MGNGMYATIIIALFAVIIVAVVLVFRSRARINIKGPFKTGLEIDASNEPPQPVPGVVVEDAKSRKGGILAEDHTGRGARISQVEVQDDIIATSGYSEETTPPKARPPEPEPGEPKQ